MCCEVLGEIEQLESDRATWETDLTTDGRCRWRSLNGGTADDRIEEITRPNPQHLLAPRPTENFRTFLNEANSRLLLEDDGGIKKWSANYFYDWLGTTVPAQHGD